MNPLLRLQYFSSEFSHASNAIKKRESSRVIICTKVKAALTKLLPGHVTVFHNDVAIGLASDFHGHILH